MRNREFYKIMRMSVPTKEMYGIKDESVVFFGAARRFDWGTTIDIDPRSNADIICNAKHTPFVDKQFDVAILDFVLNYCKPNEVDLILKEANRVSKRVVGRIHYSKQKKTLRGLKQAFCLTEIPKNIELVEIREH